MYDVDFVVHLFLTQKMPNWFFSLNMTQYQIFMMWFGYESPSWAHVLKSCSNGVILKDL